MRALWLLGALASTACSSSAPQYGFAVALTMRFDDSVSGAALDQVAFIDFDVPQDSFADNVALGRAAHRTEEVVYRPTPDDVLLTFNITATNAAAGAIATGKTTVALAANATTSAEVTLSAVSSNDAGIDARVPEDASDDGGHDLLDAAPGQVALSFVTAPLIATAHTPVGVAVADFNGDGRNDVAVAASTGAVQVFLGTASGFPSAPSFSSSAVSTPGAIGVGNFGGSASPDLVVADKFNNLLVFLINDGHGTFTASATKPATPIAPDSIAVADFDHDGLPDVAVSSSTQLGIDVYLSTSVAAYSLPMTLPNAQPPAHLHAVDLNHDGYYDLVYAFTIGSAIGYHINAAGNLAGTEQTLMFGGPYDVMPYDLLNDDGYPELLILGALTGTSSPTNAEVVDNTAGTLSTPNQPFALGITPVQSGALLDFEGTGKPDLVLSETDAFQLGRISSVVPFAASLASYVAGASPGNFAVADLDSDGLDDVALVNVGSDSVSLLRQLSAGQLYAAPMVPNAASIVSLGDWNGDGVPDLIESDGSNKVYLLPNDGAGNFTVIHPSLPIAAAATATGDLNEDRIPDLVLAGAGGELGGALGQGGGSFAAASFSGFVASDFVGITAKDIDGDHHIDAVALTGVTAGNQAGANVVYARGDGSGYLGTAVKFSAPGAIAIATADLDEDGHLDVLALSATPAQITWLRGQAGGTLVAGTPIASPVLAATSFVPCDANHDGHVDLVVGGSTIHVLVGNGKGTFTDGGTLFSAQPTVGLVAGDADGDGVAEVFAATADSLVHAFRVTGGALVPAGTFSAGGYLTTLLGADLNGDKLFDLLPVGHEIAFLKNHTK